MNLFTEDLFTLFKCDKKLTIAGLISFFLKVFLGGVAAFIALALVVMFGLAALA